MLLRALVATLLPCMVLAACGGAGGSSQATTRRPPPAARDPLQLPAGVPRTATGPADAAATRTIRRWADALRAGRVQRAAALWGRPAKVQNGTPVILLRTLDDIDVFNDSLPCGAVLTNTGGARGYTIATFRLTERRGGQCGAGVGQPAQTAIRVRDGQIVEWYRLPETQPAPIV